MPQAAAEQLRPAGWELTAPMSPGAVEPQKSSKRGAEHLLELSAGFSLWGNYLSSVQGGEKGSMKMKQVLGMLGPLRAPITPALPECPLVQI